MPWTFVSSIPVLKVGENLGRSGNIHVAAAVRGTQRRGRGEEGGKLYSTHDVRNDSGIMATAMAKGGGPVGNGEGN